MILLKSFLAFIFLGIPILEHAADFPPPLINFADSSVKLDANELGFNRLIIKNRDVSEKTYRIKALDPDRIHVISDLSFPFVVNAHSEIIVPIRFSYKYGNSHSPAYQATFEVSGEDTMDTFKVSFEVIPVEKKEWEAQLLDPIIRLSDEEGFSIRVKVRNKGNKTENFVVAVSGSNSPEIKTEINSFSLLPRQDSLIRFDYPAHLSGLKTFQKEEFQLKIEDGERNQKLMKTTVQIVGSEIKQHNSRWQELPLAVELQGFSSSFYKPSLYLNLQGNVALDESKSVGMNFKKNIIGNKSDINNLNQIRYQSNRWSFTAGSILKFSDFLINGNGVSATYYKSDQEQQSFSISKSKLSPVLQTEYNGAFVYSDKIRTEMKSFANIDSHTGAYNFLLTKYLEYRPTDNLKIGGMGGYSLDAIHESQSKINGQTYGYLLDLKHDGYFVSSQIQSYSKGYIGINKGFSFHKHQVRKVLGTSDIGIYYNNFIRSPLFITPDSTFTVESMKMQDIGFRSNIRFSANSRGGIIISKKKQQYASVQSPEVQFQKIIINYGYNPSNKKFSFSTKNSVSSSTIGGYSNAFKQFSYSNQSNIQVNSWGLRTKFDYGPLYYHEVLLSFEEQSVQRRIKISPYYEFHKTGKTIIHNSTQLEYNENQVFSNRGMLFLRNNLNLNITSVGVQTSLSLSFDLLNPKNNMISFNLRKNLVLKNTGIPKYKDLKLRLFKDKNNNRVFDHNDEPIAQAYLLINDRLALTDESGYVIYRHVEKGNYKIGLTNLGNLNGWVPVSGTEQIIYLDKDMTHSIPFQKSNYITGQVQMIYDPNKSDRFSPYGMKINLLSKEGKNFSTVVDNKGRFNFNVPPGNYNLTIDDQGLPKPQYKIDKKSHSVNVIDNEQFLVTFTIRQSSRKINVRKLHPKNKEQQIQK